MKLWQKDKISLEEVEKFTVGKDRELDVHLAPFDVLGSLAHIRMLQSVGLLTKEELDALKAELDARGIGNAIYYPVPLHMQECFRELGYRGGELPVTEEAVQQVISIPVFPELAIDERSRVIDIIQKFYA